MRLLIRATNILRGVISLVVSGLERKNPEALLELEKENLRKLIGRFNDGLISHAALCERMMSQVRKNEREQAELNGKVTAHIKAGNREAAGQYALRLKNVERDLEENHSQLTEAETTYTNLVRAREAAVSEAKARIETVRRSIGDLKIRRATAELQSMANAMVDELGGSGDTLNRLHEMVEEERDKAAGHSRVATQAVDLQELEIKESEQKALADQALEEFLLQADALLPASATPIPIVLPQSSDEGERAPLIIEQDKPEKK